ncbi:MAG: TIM barrel protein [Eubacteriales bacterium]|nr:TIM barrel protein [Eubacteriales bacterium]
MAIRFGPSGNSDSFYAQGYKKSVQAPKWIAEKGLTAYEYSFGKGITISEGTAREIGAEAARHGLSMSVHAPYYINFASPDAQRRQAGIEYIRRSAQALSWFGGSRVVFHPGSCAKISRQAALANALAALEELSQTVLADYPGITICPETMGKVNQLGTVEEVVALCRVDERYLPTVDFGHVNARGQGALKTKEDYRAVLDCIENGLGYERLKSMHVHFSRIEYTAAGEKRHLTFEDSQYGPFFEPLAELIVEKKLEPVIICESKGTMAEDAVTMQQIYQRLLAEQGGEDNEGQDETINTGLR